MGYFKQLAIRIADRRREAAGRARDRHRHKLQLWADYYDVFVDVGPFQVKQSTMELLMGLSDFLPGARPQDRSPADEFLDDTFMSEYPGVWELCTAPLAPDGSPRKMATLSIFVDDSQWKVKLHERNLGIGLWAGGPTFLAALQSLERRLHASPIDWRPDPASKRR